MPEHPCANGLTSACFKAYPAWARQAFAYKLLHIMLPKQLSKDLPRGLNLALVPPGVILPPGVVLPPGTIVPPDVTFPPGWTPPDPAPPGVVVPPGTTFPPGWTPGDPAPPGVVIPPGTIFPPGWTPGDPAPPGVQLPPSVSPVPPDSGAVPPIYVQPWEPGPVRPPELERGLGYNEATIIATDSEIGESTGLEWVDIRDSTMYATVYTNPLETVTPIYVTLSAGNYTIKRSIFKFSLSGIPAGATITEGYLSLKLYDGVGVSVVSGTCPEVWWENVNDYLSFVGDPSSYQSLNEGENQFQLSTESLGVIQGNIGSDCYIMAREYDHDYIDSPPGDEELFSAQVWKANAPIAANRPTLVITYHT